MNPMDVVIESIIKSGVADDLVVTIEKVYYKNQDIS